MILLNLGLLIVLAGYWIGPIAGHYPGLRRPPSIASLEYPSDILTQLIDQARRRFHHQLAQQQFYNLNNNPHTSHHHGSVGGVGVGVHGPNIDEIVDSDSDSYPGPSYTYRFPEIKGDLDHGIVPFAVNPSDPRFYEAHDNGKSLNDDGADVNDKKEDSSRPLDEQPTKTEFEKSGSESVTYFKPKASSMNVNPNPRPNALLQQQLQQQQQLLQQQPQQFLPKPFRGRDDIKKLVERLEMEGKANAVLNGEQQQLEQQKMKEDELVVRQRMGLEGEVGMYLVALLAGITAAILVGIMALGIAWVTLQKRTKAAADVEYPAYGVTGPNKDLSPSGDRRLAQSAQMYHYQHQKQQIIAMENRQTGENHGGGLSDVESDDDNEEGDYTVYECPGLAPTGEMEVKNPLFLDDTPITPVLSVMAPNASETPIPATELVKTTDQQAAKSVALHKLQQAKSPMKPKHTTPPPAPQRKSQRSPGGGGANLTAAAENGTTTTTKKNKSVK